MIGRTLSGRTNDPWIEKCIFPNSMLPSMAQIAAAAEFARAILLMSIAGDCD
jgi:cyclopropane fatty-acyl-phospholipid synthase-like methyltransferase